MTIALYIGYHFGSEKVFLYMPSYDIQACYTTFPNDLRSIELHSNISVTMILVIHAIECFLFILCIHKLRNIKDDFNIRDELFAVGGVWFFTSYLATAFFIYTNAQQWEYLTFLLVARSFIVSLITTIRPIYLTYQNGSYFLLPPSIGSIESLDMVLNIPIASECFFDFLDKQQEDPEPAIFFSLYADL